MKTLVLYDSIYGNTEIIANAVGKELSAKVLRVGNADPSDLKMFDLLIIGSPVHGGRATPAIEAFIKKAPAYLFKGLKVAAFDTRFAAEDHGLGVRVLLNVLRFAAERIAKDLVRKGSTLVVKPEGFIVEEKAGPLKTGELERATSWAKEVYAHG